MRGNGYEKQGGLIDYFVDFLFTFTILSDEYIGVSTCTH